MGQTWAVVAIGLSIGIALLLLFWSRAPSAPAARPGAKAGDPKPKEGPGKAAPEKGGAPAKAAATGEGKAKGDARAKEDAKVEPGATPGPARSRAQTIPEPAVARKQAGVPSVVEKLHADDDDEITIVTLTPRLDLMAAAGTLPDASGADDGDDDAPAPDSERPAAVPIIYDAEAAEDEPTRTHAVILVAAVGQTDLGQKRKINEDRYLALDEHNLYVVADGMGGHAGGEVASQLACDVIEKAFNEQKFEGAPYEDVPRRGGELALAIQMANTAIFERAKHDPKLQGMGTTIVSARFTPGKERVYIGHVGDSRCYRFRAGQLTQVTTDHTMGAIGMTGPFADHLSRAVGIAPAVKVDLVIAKPRHEDVFLLCSDGLSKMVKDEAIRDILAAHEDPNEAVQALVQRANEKGGRDNITVILVVVKDPTGFVRYAQTQQQKKKKAEAAGAEAAGPTSEAPEIKVIETDATVDARASGDVKARVSDPGRTTIPDARASGDVKARVSDPGAAADARASGDVKARVSDPGRTTIPDARPSVPDRKSAPDAKAASAETPASPEPPASKGDGEASKKRKKKG